MRIATAAAAAFILAVPAATMAQDHSGHHAQAGQGAGQGAGHSADHAADHATHGPSHHALMMAAQNANRDGDRARDAYRHPVETLTFFQVEPEMKVGEYAPGGGWYSRMLGNYLGSKGQLVGLFFNPTTGPFDAAAQQGIRDGAAKFPAQVAGWTGLPADRFSGMTLENIPEDQKGTFDRILVIRMMHNLTRWNTADSEFKAMRELLKPDGMIGIVQHRARPGAPYAYADGSKGYMRQDDVIAFMRINGFELVESSEVNANRNDSADHAEGVWEMPPALSTKREDLKDKGESDRMTLLFRKRIAGFQQYPK